MLVDKQILIQYMDIKREIADLQDRICKIQRQIEKIDEEGCVKDKVMGGEGGLQPFNIEGFPIPEYSRKRTLLMTRKNRLEILENDLLSTINEVDEFISAISDSQIRQIVRYRVLDELSWRQIAQKIGGGNTEDSTKKIFYRYFDKVVPNVPN